MRLCTAEADEDRSMDKILGVLSVLGNNFWLVIIGCAEVFFALVLIVTYMNRGRLNNLRKSVSDVKGLDSILLDEVKSRRGEGFIIMRKYDSMPLYAAGDIKDLLGVDIDMLKKDITCVKNSFKNPSEAKNILNEYSKWDETGYFEKEFIRDNSRWIRLSVTRCEQADYHIFYIWDTTDYHEMLSKYEEKTRQAEEQSYSKTSFLSRMSHEIRTPMNGIIGMLTLAKDKITEEDAVYQYIDKAEELSGHMLSLINDILDMSRIEAGKVELENKAFSIKALGTKLYDMFAKNLEANGIKYSVNYENMTVDDVVGDELRISQVIINFLSNAVKFTSKGEVSVTFRQMLLKDGILDILVRVHDTGIGMDPDFIKRIFRPFEQESIDTSRQYGGTGLGMAISDQLVKLMGGEILVDSVKGEGSDFFLYLHLPVADEAAVKDNDARKTDNSNEAVHDINVFEGRRILMAEDNEINAMVATEIIENMGAVIEVVGDGRAAVESFKSHEPGYYDFILMDVQMPVMDGRTAARTIRALDRKDASDILIFALSADAFVEDERLSLESGMNGHFAKPLDFKVLQKEIAGIMYSNSKSGRKTNK